MEGSLLSIFASIIELLVAGGIGGIFIVGTWGIYVRYSLFKHDDRKEEIYSKLMILATSIFVLNYLLTGLIVNNSRFLDILKTWDSRYIILPFFVLFWVTNICLQTPFIKKIIRCSTMKAFFIANLSYFFIYLSWFLLLLGVISFSYIVSA